MSKNATSFQEIYLIKKYKTFWMFLHFQYMLKQWIFTTKKYVIFTYGSKRGGMATCFVINLKTVFVNIYTYLKQCMSWFLIYKSLMSWKCFKHISYLYLWRYVIKMFNLMSMSDTLWLTRDSSTKPYQKRKLGIIFNIKKGTLSDQF